MKAEDDGEGACRQQLWAELLIVLKHRMIFAEDLSLGAIDETRGLGGL